MDQTPAKKEVKKFEDLTPQNRLFISLLLEGKKTVEAYRLAGYEGENTSAYQLKSRLNSEIAEMAEARGMSEADFLIEMGNLNELPVVDKDGDDVVSVTMDEKLRLLSLHQKVIALKKNPTKKITAIQINRYDGDRKSDAVETTIISEDQLSK